jgi:hypothetical protein
MQNSLNQIYSHQPDRKTIVLYAALASGSFVFGLLVLALLIWNVDRLSALHLTGNFYYISLLPLGVSVSLCLFGILKSYGAYRGRLFGGVLELGGPIVGFFLVVVLGFVLPNPADDFTFTLFAHGQRGRTDSILKSNGQLLLYTGGRPLREAIQESGQAYFPGISPNFKGKTVNVGLDAAGFELADDKQTVELKGDSAYVEVRRSAAVLSGKVYDQVTKQPIGGTTISVAATRVVTAPDGTFKATIEGDDVVESLTLRANHTGYQEWSDFVVPNSNAVSIELVPVK